MHNRWIPANDSSISACIPSTSVVRSPGRLPRGVSQQRGLSDARLAAEDQNGALTIARLSEHGVETFALACAAYETHPPGGWHQSKSKAAAEPSAKRVPSPSVEERDHVFGRRSADADPALVQLASDPRASRGQPRGR